MQAKRNINSIAIRMTAAAGLAVCAALAFSVPSRAQSAGNPRVFRALPSRSISTTTSSLPNGQTGSGQSVAGLSVNAMAPGITGVNNARGGGSFQPPLAVGTIVAGDASTGRILIQSQFNGSNQVLQVNNSTRFVTLTAISASDLQSGEAVQVQGVVTSGTTGTASITASAITAGQIPAFLQQTNRTLRVGGNISGKATTSQSTTTSTTGAQTPTPATLTGLITSVSPLVIKLNSGAFVTVTTANAQINRVTPLSFSELQVGERLMGTGVAVYNGAFILADVAISM